MQNLLIQRDKFGRFIKGIQPWNKGTIGICKSKKTSFKVGHKWPKHIEKKRIAHLYRCSPNFKSNKIAYLLGILKGDGFVNYSKKYNRYILGLASTNLKFCKSFSNTVESINLRPSICRLKKLLGVGKRRLYYVIANSQIFYKWYTKLSLNKLKKLLDTKEKKNLFIKGFYESEGSILKTKNKRYRISFANTDKNLLRMTDNLLKEIGFVFHLNGPYKTIGLGKKPHYELRISKQDQIKKFINIINPTIKNG